MPIIFLFKTYIAVAGNLQLEKGDYWKWSIPCVCRHISADPIETDKIYQTGTIITESHRIV